MTSEDQARAIELIRKTKAILDLQALPNMSESHFALVVASLLNELSDEISEFMSTKDIPDLHLPISPYLS